MDLANTELNVSGERDGNAAGLHQLDDLQLALVGGGIGDVYAG